jgi:Tfp pilus assembly protein PilF
LDRKAAWYWGHRAHAYLRKNEPAKAVQDLGTAIKLDPKSYHYFYNRAVAHNRLGDKQQALSDYQTVLRLVGQKQVPQDDLNMVESSKEWIERLSK